MKVTIKKITAKTNNSVKAQAKPATEKSAMPTMPTMSETMFAEMQKMMGKQMMKDMMDTSMYLIKNAVIKDGKMYTPVTNTYIGWFDGCMGWCDSQGYRLLIEEVNSLKSDSEPEDSELEIDIPEGYEAAIECEDDCYGTCPYGYNGHCEQCDNYRACIEDSIED